MTTNGTIILPGTKNQEFEKPDDNFIPYGCNTGDEMWFKAVKRHAPTDIFVVKECSSTMILAENLNKEGLLKDYGSVVSQVQTAGRGQHDKGWVSKSGNLFVSLKIPFVFTGEWSENYLPLLMGDLICETLGEFGIYTQLKWPNDILLSEKKLAGILVEKKDNCYIAGIGMNIKTSPGSFFKDSSFSLPSVSLAEKGIQISNPLVLWESIIDGIYDFFNKRLAKEMPSALINSLIQKLVWLNQEVWLNTPAGKAEKCILKGLSEDGGLILRKGGEERLIYSGSIRAVRYD